MKLGEIGLVTGDVRRLADFYKALLKVDNGSADDAHQVLLEGEVALTVTRGEAGPRGGQGVCLAFTVEDVCAEHERLLALGAEIVQPPRDQPWGARNLIFLDPDGNVVYLRQLI